VLLLSGYREGAVAAVVTADAAAAAAAGAAALTRKRVLLLLLPPGRAAAEAMAEQQQQQRQQQAERDEGGLVSASDFETEDEERPLIGPGSDQEEAGGEQQGSRRSRLKDGIRQKGRKLKRRIDNSKAPMTILWGRDGWEKFVALCIMGISLIFQFVGLFGTGWLKHCYSIAFQPNKLERCPSYHLWDVCRAKGSNGCLGYNAAIFLFTVAIFATIAIIHALWAYLKVSFLGVRLHCTALHCSAVHCTAHVLRNATCIACSHNVWLV